MLVPPTFQQRGFEHSIRILRFYNKLTAASGVPRHLADQMLRSRTAIGANLEEARSAYSRRELASKQAIALKETRECLYRLRLITTARPELQAETDPLLDECHQLVAMLTSSVRKLRGLS